MAIRLAHSLWHREDLSNNLFIYLFLKSNNIHFLIAIGAYLFLPNCNILLGDLMVHFIAFNYALPSLISTIINS